MTLAYAASQGAEHGAEANIGDVILHGCSSHIDV